MSGFCGILSHNIISLDKNTFTKSINIIDTFHTLTISDKSFFSAVSFLEFTPLKGSRLYKNKEFEYLFAGDLIGRSELPWKDIEENFLKSNFKWFSSLRGIFAIAIRNKKTNEITLISDQQAQLPIYYGFIGNSFIFSTSIATFSTLETLPEFNQEWLYEFIYFNFPIDTTTCLTNVKRIRPFCILNIDLKDKSIKELKYGEYFKISNNILTGKSALEEGIKIFKETVPKYFCLDKKNSVAISGGFDTRTLLALVPEKANLITYTYGVPGALDLYVSSILNKKLKYTHRDIFFDNDFEKSLPSLIYETVRLSGGVQPILRSTLLYVYSVLSKIQDHRDSNVVIGGIGGDLYRGSSGQPGGASMSSGMYHLFKFGKLFIDKNKFQNIFHSNFVDFENHIKKTINNIKELYGDPLEPETFNNYCIYEINPKYFGGEVAIANNFKTMRLPFLDFDLLQFAYRSELSNIGFSGYRLNLKDISVKKYRFQSKIICSNQAFQNTIINGLPVSLYAQDNKIFFYVGRFLIRALQKLKLKTSTHNRLEDWDQWCANILKSEFDKILSHDSLILNYLDEEVIATAKNTNDIQMLNKLVTIEILLGLLKNKWNIKQ